MKTLFVVVLALFFHAGCSTNTYQLSNNSLNLHLENKTKEPIKINIIKSIKKTQYDSKVLDGYTLDIKESNFGKLYIEYITLLDKYTWGGFSRGFFTDLISKELNLNSMELIETTDVRNYEFTTFKINDSCILNIIFIWEVNQSTFIVDYDGLLTNVLKEGFGITDTNMDRKKCSMSFQGSLTKSNITEHYFELVNDKEDIIIP